MTKRTEKTGGTQGANAEATALARLLAPLVEGMTTTRHQLLTWVQSAELVALEAVFREEARSWPDPRAGTIQRARIITGGATPRQLTLSIDGMKRLASRLTWWPTRPHKSTPAVNAAERRGQPWIILASTSTKGGKPAVHPGRRRRADRAADPDGTRALHGRARASPPGADRDRSLDR